MRLQGPDTNTIYDPSMTEEDVGQALLVKSPCCGKIASWTSIIFGNIPGDGFVVDGVRLICTCGEEYTVSKYGCPEEGGQRLLSKTGLGEVIEPGTAGG